MQFVHEHDRRAIKIQVRWGLYGLPVGIVVWPPRRGGLKSQFLGKLVIQHPRPSQSIHWYDDLPKGIAVDSVYALLRQVEHTTSGYLGNAWIGWPGERLNLQRAITLAQEANQAALGLTSGSVADYERAQSEHFTAFTEYVSDLVRDPNKMRAREMLSRALTATDRLGRVNPSANAMLTQAASERLSRRAEQIPELAVRFTKRELVARALVSCAEEVVFDPLRTFVVTLLVQWDAGKRQSAPERAVLITRCLAFQGQCDTIDWRPHRTSAMCCSVSLLRLQTSLRTCDWRSAALSAAIIRNVLERQLHQRRIGAIIQVFRSGRGSHLTGRQIGRFRNRIEVTRDALVALCTHETDLVYDHLGAVLSQAEDLDGRPKASLSREDCDAVVEHLKVVFDAL